MYTRAGGFSACSFFLRTAEMIFCAIIIMYCGMEREKNMLFEIICTLSKVITAVIVIGGAAFGIVKWYLKQEKQDKDIVRIKEEDTLIVFALSACLDGLQQLGANHTVPIAKDKLDKYINKKAHE